MKGAIRRPVELAWVVSLAMVGLMALIWLAAHPSVQAATTIKGEGVCRACALHEGHEHVPAIRVISKGATNIYYLENNSTVAGLSFCRGPRPVVAQGFVKKEGVHLWLNTTNFSIQKTEEQPEKSK